MWDAFQIENLGRYHDLYMQTEVHLLAEVFENFRHVCQSSYGLDPAQYYTAPDLAWDACLKMTKVRPHLLTDIDQHLFVEKVLWGGVSMIRHRHAQANNPYLPNYDPNEKHKYSLYVDANIIYGWAMSQALPTHGFRWLTKEEIAGLGVSSIPDDSENGLFLEVDLEYPNTFTIVITATPWPLRL